MQIDYSLLLHRHTGCPWRDGDLYERGRAGGVEVLAVGTTNKQVICSIYIKMHRIMTTGMNQEGYGALDFGQDRTHPPRADQPHPLRLATPLVIEVVTDRSLHEQKQSNYDSPMLIMTYGAILSLAILRDPLTQLDRAGLLIFLQTCQQDDGRFAHSFTLRLSTHCLSPICEVLYYFQGTMKGIYE